MQLPDGRKGIIDHFKSDGNFGVRPVDENGDFIPNSSKHWTLEQRMRVPEEISVHSDFMRALNEKEIPERYRRV